jgi:hypothetical protein
VQVVQLAPGAVAEDDINPNGAWECGCCCVTVATANISLLVQLTACSQQQRVWLQEACI